MGDPWNEGGFSGEDEWVGEESVADEDEDEDGDEDELALDLEELGEADDDDLAG